MYILNEWYTRPLANVHVHVIERKRDVMFCPHICGK